jgi:hypothetical protein
MGPELYVVVSTRPKKKEKEKEKEEKIVIHKKRSG